MSIHWGRVLQFFTMTILVQFGAAVLGFEQVGQIMITACFAALFFHLVGPILEDDA